VEIENDHGYCGPFGKCIGHITFNVDVRNVEQVVLTGFESVTNDTAAIPPPVQRTYLTKNSSIPPVVLQASQVWMECGLPLVPNADVDKIQDWKICRTNVVNAKAKCQMDLFAELQAGGQKKAYCVLTDGSGGKRLTQVYLAFIANAHDTEGHVSHNFTITDKTAQYEAAQAAARQRAAELRDQEARILAASEKVKEAAHRYERRAEVREVSAEVREADRVQKEYTRTYTSVRAPSEFRGR
jgi:hypothetical protein